MGERRWRRWTIALVVGLLAPLVVPEVMAPAEAASLCGAKDLPETGVQGDVPLLDLATGRADQGYNCGLALVGYNSLGARGGNANMAWSGNCAYIAGDGVAVVDVSNPQRPRHVRTLQSDGSKATVETLHAIDAPGRHLLATGRYGLFGLKGNGQTGPVDIWDVADCTRPKLLSTIQFPANVHNLTFEADGKRIWSTLPLQAADLTDPRKPKVLRDIEADFQAQGDYHFEYAHEAWPSADGDRLYVGGQLVTSEDLIVVDISQWPAKQAKILGRVASPGHSIRPATINGTPYLVNSDESILNLTAKGCLPDALTPFGGTSRPFLTDISNEHRPKVRSEIQLDINTLGHCADQLLSGTNASVHYQDVDDPDDTTFVMSSAWNAGLRITDVRDPLHPKEVAYFNPGRFPAPNPFAGELGIGTAVDLQSQSGLDQAWAHVRYREDTGHLWLTTASGGFWVLELEPQVRKALDLPARPTLHPKGAIPRPGPTRGAAVQAAAPAGYCTLDQLLARTRS